MTELSAEAVRRALDQAVQKDFLTFLQKAFMTLSDGERLSRNWHQDAIAHRLDLIEREGGKRQIINVPPRSLKSVTISVAWVAHMLGRNPRLKFVCVSYSQELALTHARDCRRLMQSEWYRRIFPETVLDRVAEHDLRTTAGGGRFTTSVGGTLTGRGGDIIIIDDPIKPDDAHSESVRRTAIEWYQRVLTSRLDSKTRGSIVLVMQRVHQGDLAGHLLDAGGWDLLSLPAIAKVEETIPLIGGRVHHRRIGDLLHPDRENQKVLDGLKAEMSSADFEAQYQQAPVPPGGNIIKAEWFGRYDVPPERQGGGMVVQSWDCANKTGDGNDWSACVTALVRGGRYYVLDVYRGRLEFPDLVKKAKDLAGRFRPDTVLIEDAASGQQLLQWLKRDDEWDGRPVGVKPIGDKEARLNRPTAVLESGRVLLPDQAPWLDEFLIEALGFPNARHDDQVDALAQLLNWDTARPVRLGGFGGPVIVTVREDGSTWCSDPALNEPKIDELGQEIRSW